MAGWQVGDIITNVINRTSNRLDTRIDPRQEFFLALDEFVNERRFWWRSKDFILPLLMNIASYDFSALAPDFAGQFDRVYLLTPDGTCIQSKLVPILSPEGRISAKTTTTPNNPAAFLLDISVSLTTLRLQAPSNVTQNLYVIYWASPMVTDVDSTDVIPLVPPNLHYGLFNMLERRFYEVLYGQDDPRFTIADGKYQQFLEAASRIPHWAGERAREMAADDLAVHASGSSLSLGSREGRIS